MKVMTVLIEQIIFTCHTETFPVNEKLAFACKAKVFAAIRLRKAELAV